MPARMVRIVAPSRVHFGLLALGGSRPRQFGGAGVMVERPRIELRASACRRLVLKGPLRERVRRLVHHWSDWHQLRDEPGCCIEVLAAPRLHVGLGVGTQLGLSVATVLNALFERSASSVAELAQSVGRGSRSAVGTYGFFHGGFVAEPGKREEELLSPLGSQIDLPSQWRWVLIRPAGQGLHGRTEQGAFARLPPVPRGVSEQLERELHQCLLPAAASGNFEQFSESVFRFGLTSGGCFSQIQGGPYNGQRLADLVQRIRQLGCRGVGQTSWGPTLFALAADQASAEELVSALREAGQLDDADVVISPSNNTGARLEWIEPPAPVAVRADQG